MDPRSDALAFHAACTQAQEHQRATLQSIFTLNANVKHLRKHGIAVGATDDVEEVLRCLPITCYADYQPAIQAAVQVGELPCWWLKKVTTPAAMHQQLLTYGQRFQCRRQRRVMMKPMRWLPPISAAPSPRTLAAPREPLGPPSTFLSMHSESTRQQM